MTDTTVPTTTRRRVLQALGVGGTAALAGCDAPTAENQGTTPTPPSMNPAKETDVDRIAANPTDIPDPISRSQPKTVSEHMTTKELVAEVEPGVTHTYMTFDGQIPGPMVRVRQGDTVEFTITNDESNSMPHNIDLHAVRGPGGGAEASMVAPGETATFNFKCLVLPPSDDGLGRSYCNIPPD